MGAQWNNNYVLWHSKEVNTCISLLLAAKHTATLCLPNIGRMKSPQLQKSHISCFPNTKPRFQCTLYTGNNGTGYGAHWNYIILAIEVLLQIPKRFSLFSTVNLLPVDICYHSVTLFLMYLLWSYILFQRYCFDKN